MLLNYHIRRLILSSLCVGALVWLVLSGARVSLFLVINIIISGLNNILKGKPLLQFSSLYVLHLCKIA